MNHRDVSFALMIASKVVSIIPKTFNGLILTKSNGSAGDPPVTNVMPLHRDTYASVFSESGEVFRIECKDWNRMDRIKDKRYRNCRCETSKMVHVLQWSDLG